MKVIERDTNFSISLPTVKMPARVFVDLLKEMAAEDEQPEIILGDLYSPERYQLLGVDDIESHSQLITVPLTANIGSIRINLRHRWATLACQAQDVERARRIERTMAAHSPKSLMLTHDHIFYVVIVLLLALPIILPAGNTLVETVLEQVATACIAFLAWFGLKRVVARNRLTPPSHPPHTPDDRGSDGIFAPQT